MVFQSTTGYLLAFIICRGESNNQSEPLEEFYKPFDNYFESIRYDFVNDAWILQYGFCIWILLRYIALCYTLYII